MGRGTLVPDRYVEDHASQGDIEISSIIWGLSLGCTLYTFFAAGKQTLKSWRRAKTLTVYMGLVWLEWASSTIMGVICWCFLKGSIQPSLEYFMAIIVLWCFQIHTLMQIIINRISILSMNQSFIRRIKWGVFLAIVAINISVVCIWVPASLQISDRYVAINKVWDRCQKSLLCVIDAALNVYFVYLVRSRLIANGLTKYVRLFKFNLVMIVISVSLDILIVAMMSLPNKLIYVQFHPLAYLMKLQIELGQADLIVKIVRASNPQLGSSEPYPKYGGTTVAPAGGATGGAGNSGGGSDKRFNAHKKFDGWRGREHSTTIEVGDEAGADAVELVGIYGGERGIKKTVVTEVTSQEVGASGSMRGRHGDDDDEDDDGLISESSSTRRLQKETCGAGALV